MNSIFKDSKEISSDGIKLIYGRMMRKSGEDYYISLGETATQNDPYLVFVALIGKGQGWDALSHLPEKLQEKGSRQAI